jgi:Ca2+-binding RTX toxin-like protein
VNCRRGRRGAGGISAAHIQYNAATGALTFDGGGGWAPSVHFATLAPHLPITSAGFMFVLPPARTVANDR